MDVPPPSLSQGGNAARGRQGADIAPNVTNGFGGSFANDDEESV